MFQNANVSHAIREQSLFRRIRTIPENSLWHRSCKCSIMRCRLVCCGRLALQLFGSFWFLPFVRQGSVQRRPACKAYLLLGLCLDDLDAI